MPMVSLTQELTIPADEAARRLLGSCLEREFDGEIVLVKIVETEAYDASDEASHSFRGETARTAAMFGPAGHLYVYFTYGMHYCCNVVTGDNGHGAGVLIRAVEPLSGIGRLYKNRAVQKEHDLTNGPAKVCQALQIDTTWNNHDLELSPLRMILYPPLPQENIVTTTRVGISKAADMPWRFYIRDSPFVSKSVTNITKPQNRKRYSDT